MATTPTTHPGTQTSALFTLDVMRRHKLRLQLTWLLAAGFIVATAIYGYPYYKLDLPERAFSPYHRLLRPSGTIGGRLGLLGLAMFFCLFLYPIRKHWAWLGSIGKTKHWLDFHVLLGITAPVVVTLHSSFKLGGLAGVAYWIMIAVALSGFIGRYLYAQIPRRLSMAEMSLKEMEDSLGNWALQLAQQHVLPPEEIAPLLAQPSREDVERMPIWGALKMMIRMDAARPFQVSRLRRRFLTPARVALTLGGLLPSGHRELEGVITAVRGQAWLSTKMLYLTRVQEVFHLWHVVHRPFSYSFAVLVGVHVVVVMLLGYY